MPATLRDLQRKSSYSFLEKLVGLKGHIADKNDLKQGLESLHRAFLRMSASFDIARAEAAAPEEPVVEETGTEITKHTAGPFVFLAVGQRVIGLEGSYYLEPFVVNRPVDDVPLLARMYADYKSRRCDVCGCYFYDSTFETPTGRSVEIDFVAAYHLPCKQRELLR